MRYPVLGFTFLILTLSTPIYAVIIGGDSRQWNFDSWTTKAGDSLTTNTSTNNFHYQPVIKDTILASITPAIERTEDGLTLRADGTTVLLDPYHVGMDNRPLTHLPITVDLEGKELKEDSLIVDWRYSTTGELWSYWSPMRCIKDEPGRMRFNGELKVPAADTRKFRQLWNQWAYEQNNWRGDNADEYYDFVQSSNPQMMEEVLPLIRFVQVRLKWKEGESAILTKLKSRSDWVVSGLKQ